MPVRPVRPVRPQASAPPAMFSFCPQQSIRIFANTPLHGLVDPQQAFFNNLNSNQVIPLTSWSAPTPVPDNPIAQDKSISAGKKRLYSLLEELDPDYQIDQETEESLLMFADHFINQVSFRASKFAKHANSPFLRVKDICLELEQNWNCRIPGFETTKIAKQRSPQSSHTSKLGIVWKARRDADIAKASKIILLNNAAAELQSMAELKEGESLEVSDEVSIPDHVHVKTEESVNSLNDTPAATDIDENDDEDNTPIGQTPLVESSVGTPAESLIE